MLSLLPIGPSPRAALDAAKDHAPYLARLALRHGDLLDQWAHLGPEEIFAGILAQMRAVGQAGDETQARSALRHAKARGHFLIAAADLCGAWHLDQVTRAMTDLADCAVQGALEYAVSAADLERAGVFVVALGKMGAGELNYSSDIDIAVFYDPDRFDGKAKSPGEAATAITRHLVRLLDERTEEGYVFRTDLRLRPDPSSTPLAVSTRMAENYYESVGQNWERMVWIKARPMAGDLDTAGAFLPVLTPFIWRRHLDYWAINDIYAIKRMINASSKNGALNMVNPDVKLGPGGIREIEFFAQTQQLILGGRDRELRVAGTLEALGVLADKGHVARRDFDFLSSSYRSLRMIEHRIQMMQDAQTHLVPEDTDARARLASLCGLAQLAEFDAGLLSLRQGVHEIYVALFAEEDRQQAAAVRGNLVFTGVDDDPGTVETLTRFGFADPPRLISAVRHWHRGKVPATRNPRGRELLTALLPGLLSDMAETGEPDAAFSRFQLFFERLRAGVQTLSMLVAEPALRSDLVATLALAPRLATELGRRPALLEALLGAPQNTDPITGLDFETAMDEMRRQHRERAFLIGYDLLHAHITAKMAGARYSDLADFTIRSMADAAAIETERRFGACPGEWLICAMGKLGGREMTAGSDLDLIVIYETEDPIGSGQWFTRFTQRLITALSAETGEGALYEVDMRLRPSGRAGPVAVRHASFERYHREDAWTWERMALTRIRPIVGQAALWQRFEDGLARLNAVALDPVETRCDILDMRRRLAREKPGGGLWELKSAPGGLVDIEFIAQYGLLQCTGAARQCPETPRALDLVAEAGLIGSADTQALKEAHRLFASLQQIQRLALSGDVDAEDYPEGLKRRLARAVGLDRLEEVKTKINESKETVVEIRGRLIGPI